MIKGVLFIGGVADGKWIAVRGKPDHYKIPILPKGSYLSKPVKEEDTVYQHETYRLHWWLDEIPMYLETHMTLADALKRLARYYRPENQDD